MAGLIAIGVLLIVVAISRPAAGTGRLTPQG
jgi:hypothetical protein